MADNNARPKRYAPWYNISLGNLPLPGLVSIFHRVSGLGIFVMIWLLLWLFDSSLASPEGYEDARAMLSGGFMKLVMTGLLWAFLHHFCAGIRFLLLDMHVGIALAPARRSSGIVFAVSLLLTLILGAMLVW
jgi:succinate dehydrogenase / fumarate reductase cytochrome b subunit